RPRGHATAGAQRVSSCRNRYATVPGCGRPGGPRLEPTERRTGIASAAREPGSGAADRTASISPAGEHHAFRVPETEPDPTVGQLLVGRSDAMRQWMFPAEGHQDHPGRMLA